MLLVGVFGIFIGLDYLAGNQAIPQANMTGGCRAICGLTLLFSELFSEDVGKIVAGILWLGLGITFCLTSFYKLLYK